MTKEAINAIASALVTDSQLRSHLSKNLEKGQPNRAFEYLVNRYGQQLKSIGFSQPDQNATLDALSKSTDVSEIANFLDQYIAREYPPTSRKGSLV